MLSRLFLRIALNYGLDRRYWQIRQAQQWLFFHIGNSGFKFRRYVENTSFAIQVFFFLFWSVLGSLLLTAVAFVILLGSNVLFGGIGKENQSSYDSALLAIASVIGIFLSLYFTSINTVIGTIYAKLPSRIRDLILRERVGSVSIVFLVSLTLLCILLLTAGIVADLRPRAAIIIVGTLGCFSILVFVELSKRAFSFFDPTVFSNQLLSDLYQWSEQSTSRGYRWNDPAFQYHYFQRAQESLQGVSALVAVAHEENHLKREPLAKLFAGISVFCIEYIKHRKSIPTTSKWYTQIPKHRDWYLTSDSSIQIANQTQTSLQPEWKPDPRWLERELLDLEIQSLSKCFADDRKDVGFQIVNYLNSIFHELGHAWMVDYGQQTLEKVDRATRNFLSTARNTEIKAEKDHDLREILGVVDYVALYPIALLLGAFQLLNDLNIEQLEQSIARIDWRDSKLMYSLGLPLTTLDRLEFIQERLEFEMRVEGRIVSPTWYLSQLICQPIAFALQDQVEKLRDIGVVFYKKRAQELVEQKQSLQGAALISRGLEFYNKFLAHLSAAENFANALERKRLLQELKWPEWNWTAFRDSLVQDQKSLLVDFAKCIPGLAEVERDDSLPDYFGQAVHTSGEQCFQALT